MKRSARRLLTLLLCACLITGLLPVTALAANFPSEFYASVTYKYEIPACGFQKRRRYHGIDSATPAIHKATGAVCAV